MAVPVDLRSELDAVEPALRGVASAVANARFDLRTEEQGHGLTVGEAIEAVEVAAGSWFEVADTLDRACDDWVLEHLEDGPEIRACQSALMLLQLAVVNEFALVQRLETVIDTLPLAGVPGWPTDEPARLATLAFRAAGPRDSGLVGLLYAGIDDGPEPAPDGDGPAEPGAPPGGRDPAQVQSVGPVDWEDDAIGDGRALKRVSADEIAAEEAVRRGRGAPA